jgi:hypothetical protein
MDYSLDRPRDSIALIEISIAPQVLDQRVADATVLLHLGSGCYYSLDGVGSRAWELLREHGRLEAVHRALLAEYEVSAERLWRDLQSLVDQLADHRLLEVRHGGL